LEEFRERHPVSASLRNFARHSGAPKSLKNRVAYPSSASLIICSIARSMLGRICAIVTARAGGAERVMLTLVDEFVARGIADGYRANELTVPDPLRYHIDNEVCPFTEFAPKPSHLRPSPIFNMRAKMANPRAGVLRDFNVDISGTIQMPPDIRPWPQETDAVESSALRICRLKYADPRREHSLAAKSAGAGGWCSIQIRWLVMARAAGHRKMVLRAGVRRQ
jgi:hypothetical protein